MRRLFAFFALLLLLLTTGGRALLYHLRLAEVRTEMRAALARGERPGEVITMDFSPSAYEALQWLEDDREFALGGAHYDVLAATRTEAKVVVHVLADKKESDLAQRYQRQQKEGGSSSQSLVKLLSVPFVAPSDISIFPIPSSSRPEYTIVYKRSETDRDHSVLTPPPRQQFFS